MPWKNAAKAPAPTASCCHFIGPPLTESFHDQKKREGEGRGGKCRGRKKGQRGREENEPKKDPEEGGRETRGEVRGEGLAGRPVRHMRAKRRKSRRRGGRRGSRRRGATGDPRSRKENEGHGGEERHEELGKREEPREKPLQGQRTEGDRAGQTGEEPKGVPRNRAGTRERQKQKAATEARKPRERRAQPGPERRRKAPEPRETGERRERDEGSERGRGEPPAVEWPRQDALQGGGIAEARQCQPGSSSGVPDRREGTDPEGVGARSIIGEGEEAEEPIEPAGTNKESQGGEAHTTPRGEQKAAVEAGRDQGDAMPGNRQRRGSRVHRAERRTERMRKGGKLSWYKRVMHEDGAQRESGGESDGERVPSQSGRARGLADGAGTITATEWGVVGRAMHVERTGTPHPATSRTSPQMGRQTPTGRSAGRRHESRIPR